MSSFGRQLERVELFSGDRLGNKIGSARNRDVRCHGCGTRQADCGTGPVGAENQCCADCWHPQVHRINETKPHALSHANTNATEDQEERDRQEREARLQFDKLDETDREVLRLSSLPVGLRERKMPFPLSKRADQEAAGWFYVRSYRNGTVLMSKTFHDHLTQQQIAERMGMTIYEVRKRLSKIPGEVAKFAVLRGWV